MCKKGGKTRCQKKLVSHHFPVHLAVAVSKSSTSHNPRTHDGRLNSREKKDWVKIRERDKNIMKSLSWRKTLPILWDTPLRLPSVATTDIGMYADQTASANIERKVKHARSRKLKLGHFPGRKNLPILWDRHSTGLTWCSTHVRMYVAWPNSVCKY
jgi:hypothetical protein